MGAAKRRRARFLAANPLCYFCGVAAANTIDHVPARVCFRGRESPDGFEFPACEACNSKSRDSEQVAAFYINAMDWSEDEPDLVEFGSLLSAVRNNYPTAVPQAATTRTKRKKLKLSGDLLPKGMMYSDLPIMTISQDARNHLSFFSGKLALALYYRHYQKPLNESYVVYTTWIEYTAASLQAALGQMKSVFPNLVMGSRPNTNIGQQFGYLWGGVENGEVFGFVAQFRQSFFVIGLIAERTLAQQRPFIESGIWTLHPARSA